MSERQGAQEAAREDRLSCSDVSQSLRPKPQAPHLEEFKGEIYTTVEQNM